MIITSSLAGVEMKKESKSPCREGRQITAMSAVGQTQAHETDKLPRRGDWFYAVDSKKAPIADSTDG